MKSAGLGYTFSSWQTLAPRGRAGEDYTATLNVISKVLDFDQLGGPECTVGGTVFEMWLGSL